MRRLAVLALTTALLAAPVHAEDAAPPRVDLAAAVLMGLAAEHTARMPRNETAYVTSSGPGQFAGSTEESGAAFTATLTEPESCVFNMVFTMGELSLEVDFDARRVTGISVGAGEEQAGYALYTVRFAAPADLFLASQNGGEARVMPLETRIGSSLTAEELQAGADELIRQCAAP